MGKSSVPEETRVFSVRLSVPEAQAIDAQATKAGLNRNDYMRARLLSGEPIANAGKIDDLIAALRNHDGSVDRLARAIMRLIDIFHGQKGSESLDRLRDTAHRADQLLDSSLQIQRQLIDCVRRIRRRAI